VHNIRQIESNESLELDKRISKLQFRRGADFGRCGKCTETHPVPLDPTLNDTVWQHLSKICGLLYIRNTKFEICYSDLITSSSCSNFIKPRK